MPKTTAQLDHANITVSDPAATAAWMEKLFGWHIRWQGDAIAGGHTIHVGNDHGYVALYNPGKPLGCPSCRQSRRDHSSTAEGRQPPESP